MITSDEADTYPNRGPEGPRGRTEPDYSSQLGIFSYGSLECFGGLL